MARKPKNNVEYFPFLCKEGETLFYLEETYGNDGFAVFIKLLRELARTDFHHLDLSKNTTRMFLSSRCKVSKDVLNAIITDLAELDKFDAKLWKDYSIVWCQDFIDNIQDAYLKRTNDCIDKKGLLLLLTSKGIHKPVKSTPKPDLLPLEVPDNTHSRVEDTIPDNTIEDNKKEKKTKEPTVYSNEVHECYLKCLNYFPLHLQPDTETKKNNWLDTLDKLNKIDNLELDLVRKIVKKTRSDDFWSKNFLSLTKLRKTNKDDVKFIIVFHEKFKKGNKSSSNNIDPQDMQDYLREQQARTN